MLLDSLFFIKKKLCRDEEFLEFLNNFAKEKLDIIKLNNLNKNL